MSLCLDVACSTIFGGMVFVSCNCQKRYLPISSAPRLQTKKELESIVSNSLNLLVPEVGIEPTWGRPRWILSPVRLPVSPLRLGFVLYCTCGAIVKGNWYSQRLVFGCFKKYGTEVIKVLNSRPDCKDKGTIDKHLSDFMLKRYWKNI